jgi:hypothetical protein
MDWQSFRSDLKDGKSDLQIKQGGGRRTKSIRVGDDEEWRDTIAIFGLDGTKIDEATTEDLTVLLGGWDSIYDRLRAIVEHRLGTELKIPSRNPAREKETRVEPKEQGTKDFTVNNGS